jgi:hypothetical protein
MEDFVYSYIGPRYKEIGIDVGTQLSKFEILEGRYKGVILSYTSVVFSKKALEEHALGVAQEPDPEGKGDLAIVYDFHLYKTIPKLDTEEPEFKYTLQFMLIDIMLNWAKAQEASDESNKNN